jgi:hypothetical protein
MKLSLPPKLVEKLVWVPVTSLSKIVIPNYMSDALLCRNWSFSHPNRTLILFLGFWFLFWVAVNFFHAYSGFYSIIVC